MNAAYEKGLYFDGDIDIPIIDWRPYLEEVLDMHNSHQSFASRQRMLDHDGRASNQVTGSRERGGYEEAVEAFRGDGRVAALGAPAGRRGRPLLHGGGRRDRARSAGRGPGSSTRGPDGPCTAAFPLHSTSRIVAGGPLRCGGAYKCALQPVGQRDQAGAVRVMGADRRPA